MWYNNNSNDYHYQRKEVRVMQKVTKHSKQRDALLEVLKSTKTHPTADWLNSQLKQDFPNISLGTVYRNLKMFSDNGTILKLDIGSGVEHYDGFTHDHYHLVCNCCESVSDIEVKLDSLNSVAEEATGGEISNHSLIFYGKCKNCKENGGI